MVQVVPACLAHVANKSDAHISIRVGFGPILCPHNYTVFHCERDITTAATVICLLPFYLKSFGIMTLNWSHSYWDNGIYHLITPNQYQNFQKGEKIHRFAVGKTKIYLQQNMVLPNNSLSCTGDYCSTAFCCLFVNKRFWLLRFYFYIFVILLKIITDFVITSKSMHVCSWGRVCFCIRVRTFTWLCTDLFHWRKIVSVRT